MHDTHRSVSVCAAAKVPDLDYPIGMKSVVFIPRRSETAADRAKARTPRPNHPFGLIKKALERWENEGGRIPELAREGPRAGFVSTKRG